jgi:aspartate aminotransferase
VKLPVEDAEDFSKFLLTDFHDQNQTVMLAPAKGFYSTPGVGLNEVRIAFILDSEKLIRAARILEKALQAYKKFVS